MKVFGVVFLVAGLLAFAAPVVGFLLEDGSARREAQEERKVGFLTFAPLLGVALLSVGGGLLVAEAITGKK
jgi:hypothetical protein